MTETGFGAASSRARELERKLRERLEAEHVQVIDESHLHAGHAGAASGGGHFRAVVVSARFVGLSRVAAQRLVYEALSDEIGVGIHALSLSTLTPERWRARDPS